MTISPYHETSEDTGRSVFSIPCEGTAEKQHFTLQTVPFLSRISIQTPVAGEQSHEDLKGMLSS